MTLTSAPVAPEVHWRTLRALFTAAGPRLCVERRDDWRHARLLLETDEDSDLASVDLTRESADVLAALLLTDDASAGPIRSAGTDGTALVVTCWPRRVRLALEGPKTRYEAVTMTRAEADELAGMLTEEGHR